MKLIFKKAQKYKSGRNTIKVTPLDVKNNRRFDVFEKQAKVYIDAGLAEFVGKTGKEKKEVVGPEAKKPIIKSIKKSIKK